MAKPAKKPPRRTRMVPKGAIECFELRIVHYMRRDDGAFETRAEMTYPDPQPEPDPALETVLGVLERAKVYVTEMYDPVPLQDDE